GGGNPGVASLRARRVAAQRALPATRAGSVGVGSLLQLHQALYSLVAPRARSWLVDRAGGWLSRDHGPLERSVVDVDCAGDRSRDLGWRVRHPLCIAGCLVRSRERTLLR